MLNGNSILAAVNSHQTIILWPFVWDYPGEPVPEETFHPITPILIINYVLSISSIYYDPWHPPCSAYVPDSVFAQPLSKSSLFYLLVWHPPLHTPYISSPNQCLLFATHARTIATCHAVVPRLFHPTPVSLNSPSGTPPSIPSHTPS